MIFLHIKIIFYQRLGLHERIKNWLLKRSGKNKCKEWRENLPARLDEGSHGQWKDRESNVWESVEVNAELSCVMWCVYMRIRGKAKVEARGSTQQAKPDYNNN